MRQLADSTLGQLWFCGRRRVRSSWSFSPFFSMSLDVLAVSGWWSLLHGGVRECRSALLVVTRRVLVSKFWFGRGLSSVGEGGW